MWWVVIIIFVCCLLVSVGTFLLQYYGYCPVAAGLPFAEVRHSTRSTGCAPPKEEGLPLDVIDRLKSFSLASKETVSCTEECLICQDDLGQRPVGQLPCSHVFHKSCIRDWLLRKASCPLCRTAVTEESLKDQALKPPDIEAGMGEQKEQREGSEC